MDNVSLQVPASLSDFSSTASDGRTLGKLKMFYVGETADGRVFTKEFSDKLVASLPYCPIVGFFSDIQDDFIGHNSDQYIYGIVRPDAEYSFETDKDGKEWLITDVMLYTDRPDKTGEVAKKILGKPQSLELNRKNVKYEVFNEGGKRKIKFLEGSLIGLSVLGSKQKPAFAGSEFFMAGDFSEMRERFDNFFSFLENNDSRGEQEMNNKTDFESYVEFVKLSYTDKMRLAASALQAQLGDNYCFYLEDMDDFSLIACKYSRENGETSYAKYDYSINDIEVSVSNERAVIRKFLTVEEINRLDSFENNADFEDKEEIEENDNETAAVEEEISEVAPVEFTEEGSENVGEEEEIAPAEAAFADQEEDTEETQPEEEEEETQLQEEEETQPEEEEETQLEEEEEEVAEAQNNNMEENDDEEDQDEPSKEDEDDEEFSEHTSALSDSERQELEVFRTQAKERLISEYNGLLDKKVLADFTAKINDYDYNALESALAIAFSNYTRQNKNISREIPLSFGNLNTAQSTGADNYASLVKKILNK